jgi:hypothetical protein
MPALQPKFNPIWAASGAMAMTISNKEVVARRDIVYLALAGFFVTNAILGEVPAESCLPSGRLQ